MRFPDLNQRREVRGLIASELSRITGEHFPACSIDEETNWASLYTDESTANMVLSSLRAHGFEAWVHASFEGLFAVQVRIMWHDTHREARLF